MNAYAPLRRLTALFALCLALFLVVPVAFAQDTGPIDDALTGAQDDFDMIELDAAEAKLNKAINYAKSNGIKGEPLAKLYVMRGVVRFSRDNSEAQTESDFILAVEAYKDIEIGKYYVTPELSAIMESARRKAKVTDSPKEDPKKDPPKEDPKTDPPKPDPVQTDSFVHERVKKAPSNEALVLEAFVPKSMPAYGMAIYHRRFGETDFQRTEMKPTDATRFEGTIPASQVRTSSLEYYIEVYDRGENVLARSGEPLAPHSVLLTGSTGFSNPDPDPDPDPDPTPSTGAGNVYISLGGGSGFGFLPGGEPTANPDRGDTLSPGLAPAFGHSLLDVGWIINPSMRLGLYWRFQFSPYQDFSCPEGQTNCIETDGGSFPTTDQECFGFGLPVDCLLGLKYRYYFSEDPDSFRVYSTLGAGVGRVRNWVQLKERKYLSTTGQILVENQNCAGKQTFSQQTNTGETVEFCYLRDTVRTGWFHAGLGAGLSVPLARHIDFVADTYLMLLAADQISVNIDANLGLSFWF